MENAADALKLAFGVFIFAIALVLAFSVIGQARETSDVMLALNDKTNLYEYIESSEGTKDRIVGFETILPTIYGYAKQQYAITILDASGNPIVRYDLYTEGLMNNWNTTLKKMNNSATKDEVESGFNEVRNRIELVDNMIHEENENWSNKIWNSLVTGSEGTYKVGNLYKLTSTSTKAGAPWGSDQREIINRINADLNGKNYIKNGITYEGKNLNQYRGKTFKEKFIEIQTSGTTITDEEYSLETVRANRKLEIIYIMQP